MDVENIQERQEDFKKPLRSQNPWAEIKTGRDRDRDRDNHDFCLVSTLPIKGTCKVLEAQRQVYKKRHW